MDPSATAEIEAYSYEAEKEMALAKLDDAENTVRSQEIKDYLTSLMESIFDLSYTYVKLEILNGAGIDDPMVAECYSYSKDGCASAAVDLVEKCISSVDDFEVTNHAVRRTSYLPGGDWGMSLHSLPAFENAINVMKEAYDDYQYVLTDPGICKDISQELEYIGCEIEWDEGKEPNGPGTEVTLSATSTMTRPINDDDYGPKAYIQGRGDASLMRESPWPARVLFDEGYISSMDIALGGRICDSGFYSIINDLSNYVSERTPSGSTFRRLFFNSANVVSNVEAPSEAVENIVGSLIDNPDGHIVGAAGLGTPPIAPVQNIPRGESRISAFTDSGTDGMRRSYGLLSSNQVSEGILSSGYRRLHRFRRWKCAFRVFISWIWPLAHIGFAGGRGMEVRAWGQPMLQR